MLKILRELFTGVDGKSHDLGRYSWAGCWLGVTASAAGTFWHGHDVPLNDLALAYSGVAAAHGAALWAKKDTEPKPPDEPKSITSQP